MALLSVVGGEAGVRCCLLWEGELALLSVVEGRAGVAVYRGTERASQS